MSAFIDLDGLSELELRRLNARIVERLQMLREERTLNQMTQFHLNESVVFTASDGSEVRGKVERINRKTISVLSDDGLGWKVSPGFLRKCARPSELGTPRRAPHQLPELFE